MPDGSYFCSYDKEPSHFLFNLSISIRSTSLLYDDNHIQRATDLMFVEAKEFSKISFHSIPISCWPDLLLHHDP